MPIILKGIKRGMRLRQAILITVILLAISGVGFTDQTLEITLDSPQSKSQSDLRLKHETLGATREASSKQPQLSAQSTKSSTAKEIPIGRVGTIAASKADIKSAPNKGRTLFTCPKGTNIAIVGENGAWFGVLMADSSTGWIEKSKVELLNYQVLSQVSQANSIGSKIVDSALKYLGIAYKWGGYSLDGLDCSGFVKAVFASNGIGLPRVSRDQALVGTPVDWNQLQPGDRLYFACKGGQIDHAGIYIGNGLFIHSSTSRGGVAVESIMMPFYVNSLVTARRS